MIAGRYSLDREIGRGGMGAVWLGRDVTLDRLVALKRIGVSPGGHTPDARRAEREARLAAMLSHPNIVAVFDMVEDNDQQWLVMEYVEGRSLSEIVRQVGPLEPRFVASALAQVADGLAEAHSAGIVHRDVKPSNILVTAEGVAKLTDFGIARSDDDLTLTRTGLVSGSPAYLAPEVASGHAATAASDVWSLGATLYHCLNGAAPYAVGDNVMAVLYQIVHEDPPRLPESTWLGHLLDRTMTREPADRWSAERVAGFLRQGPDAALEPLRPRNINAGPARTSRHFGQVPATGHGQFEETRVNVALPDPSAVAEVPAGHPGRLARRLVAVGGAMLVAVVAVIAFVMGQQGGGTTPNAGAASPSASGASGSETPAGPSAASMKEFIATYLATVTGDRDKAWTMLTPGFQAQSPQYQEFWSTVAEARLDKINADPDSLQVDYDVTYRRTDGSRTTDSVELQLVYSDGTYLIDGEPKG